MTKALVTGGSGFIGHHMAKRLKEMGYWVRTVDIQLFKYGRLPVDDYVIGDLREKSVCDKVFQTLDSEPWDEVYCFAAWMGGAQVIFTGDNDATIAHDSALLDILSAEMCVKYKVKKVFFSSSACVYSQDNQLDADHPVTYEDSAYPANPDSVYGWTKIWSEKLYQSYRKNMKLDVRIARFHNVHGIEGAWGNGKEKAPSSLCRKVAMAKDGDTIEIFGPGTQTRSFLYIDECIEATRRLMESDFSGPVNIGSEEMVTINELVSIACSVEGKTVLVSHIPGPLGVRGRNSNNDLARTMLGWDYSLELKEGIRRTYLWIKGEVDESKMHSNSL
jgi:nucleoside-diphosphate-sugar epimerase